MLTTSLDSNQVSDAECYVAPILCFGSVPPGELPLPAPRDCFGRDGLIEEVVGLAVKNLEPVALIGAGGIGKTSIALAVLHHDRMKTRFGGHRRFIRCDQFPASRAHFLARLSKVIGAGVENPEDLTSLRPFLSSNEILIVLDNAESILDPQGADAQDTYSVVDELCQFKTICLLITSRIMTVPRHCKRPKIPTLSMEAARDIFYRIYGDERQSRTIDDLLRRLDFHALSITLLATAGSHNGWDHDRLAKEWGIQQAQILRTDFNESLAATIELSLGSPTFHSLGPNARDLLGVVAFFPQGIDEKNLEWLFPTISDRKDIFDKFCVLSLTYRNNGFITMLAPLRDHLVPQDPQSSPSLCATRDHYFSRLSVDLDPNKPGFEEARWIVVDDVNVEHLLDVFAPIDQNGSDIWNTCSHFMEHLTWHKPRQTILGPKIETLADDHPSKPICLASLSSLLRRIGNHVERKRVLTHYLELERRRGDDSRVAHALRNLSQVNWHLCLYEEGMRQVKESLEIFERIGDTIGQAQSLNTLAILLAEEEPDDAEGAASRAIVLISGKGEEYLLSSFHRTLGHIHQSKGEKEKSTHHFNTALEIASSFNWSDELFLNHYALATLFIGEDEFDSAHTCIEQAKPYAVDDTYRWSHAMRLQAAIWYWQGRLEDAKTEALQLLEVYEKFGAAKDAQICRDLLELVELAMDSQEELLQAPRSTTRFQR